jgi:hypothetical protein
MKIIITEEQLKFLLEETQICKASPNNKLRDNLITLDDIRNGKTIKKGYCNDSENSAIVKIQKMMKEKGFLDYDGTLGYYGDKTQNAVKILFKPESVLGTEIGKKTLSKLEKTAGVAKKLKSSGGGVAAAKTVKISKTAKELSNKKYIYGVDPQEVIAATLIGEAGGETESNSLKAIYDVLENRAGNNTDYELASKALKNLQFSCWNDVGRNTSEIKNYIKDKKEHSKWNTAMVIVKNKNSGNVTKGATHYYAYKGPNAISIESGPDWLKSMKETVSIGNHKFGIA